MISLAHHWLISERGGEKVLKSFSKLFPDAPIYTLVAIKDRSVFGDWLDGHRIVTSLLQCFPGATRHYKKFLPFFPVAVSRMKVSNEDQLILSSDASVIKGLKIPVNSVHVCYCHSPPRYLWSMQETYLKHSSGLGEKSERRAPFRYRAAPPSPLVQKGSRQKQELYTKVLKT